MRTASPAHNLQLMATTANQALKERDYILAVFIDYDNLQPPQRLAGILDVVTRVLMQVEFNRPITRAKCDVRIYGGWYEGTKITRKAQDVTIEIQQDFPRILRLPTSNGYCSISANAELAVALLKEPGHHLFNTYRRKGKPTNVRVAEPAAVGCVDAECILPLAKKLLKSGDCPKASCIINGDFIYRHEQKLVDTMLSCDLIHAAGAAHDLIILVSDDDDFLPPLRTVLLLGGAAVRVHPQKNRPRAFFSHAPELVEKDL